MEDLNGDYFALLVDESCDISRKEQMTIVLHYVDRGRFIGIIHAHDTSALCLKEATISCLAQYYLSLSFLALVGVSKKCLQVRELLLLVSNVLNVVGGYFKHMDELRESQAKIVQEALDMGEVESGTGLNQELGLARAVNTRDILAITNEFNESLQKKEQDIASVILLVKVVKKRVQDLRNEGCDSLVENVFAFCVKYDILIPHFDEFYVNFERS
ncbi:hypothetical protein H5410_045280 [Solanum commersonii]|uniref:DUF4371 domain-containing protein n=1 Tax=Solanum commersonii TaxID=4109 RepID=A0A9J5XC77_SOLCO|nr:hypothetical protein H5410_045280 [Solanum commersonii]